MLIGVVENNAEAALLSLIEDINRQKTGLWGLLAIQRSALKNISNDEIVLALKPGLENATQAKAFFVGKDVIYVAWFGMLKQICEKLSAIVSQSLCRTEISSSPEKIISYYDPSIMGNELNILLKGRLKKEGLKKMAAPPNDMLNGAGIDVRMRSLNSDLAEKADFEITPAQAAHYKKTLQQRPGREQLHVLIVEDEVFLRKLLTEVLHKIYVVDTASSAEDGWKIYLNKVPDILFLDIELLGADGHFLAHLIKGIDPAAYIVMVTASHYLEDVEIAKKNRVDGFITKPFNKKKIDDCINQYLAKHKPSCKTAGI